MKIESKDGWPWLAVFLFFAVFHVGCQTVPPAEEPEREIPPEAPVPEPEPEPTPVAPEPEPVVEPTPKPPAKPKPGTLESQANAIGATVKRIENTDTWKIVLGDNELALIEGSRKASLNGVSIFLDEAFEKRRGKWSLGESDQTLVLELLKSIGGKVRLESYTVVIDPGHGGSEDGSVNETLGLLEKDLALDVAVRLQESLEGAGFKVVLTRFDDRLVSLGDRSRIANRSGAGLFVSLHFNGSTNLEAKGIETFFLTPAGYGSTDSSEQGDDAESYSGNDYDLLSLKLAWSIHSRLVKESQREDRGLKKGRFGVLKELECPGVLIEGGFLTHKGEAHLISTPVYRQRLAENIGAAIIETVEVTQEPDS